MTNQHPITPPPELVQEWASVNGTHYEDLATLCGHIATRAAQWGSDQELEACCKELEYNFMPDSSSLRAARRPKPPSLKELALEALDRMDQFPNLEDRQIVRRALEALSDD